MESLFPAIFLIFLFLCSSKPALSSTVGVDAISRLLQIQDRERAPPSVQEAAARGVLLRLLPSHSSSFQIEGATGVDVVAGLHWYLKHWCGSHISWDKTGGSQLFSVPKAGFLPRVHDAGISVQRPIPWSYYQNAVTSSYSFAWWDWQRWEKEIDWMALQGVNLPLAFTGQEAIWQKVFKIDSYNNTS
ncbi:Beta-hexosaminidase-like, domain 2 [Sesbania bispinosa]|nr:Beta-hexosaminidase-like, domain 2 [Sesbania bispinosa]